MARQHESDPREAAGERGGTGSVSMRFGGYLSRTQWPELLAAARDRRDPEHAINAWKADHSGIFAGRKARFETKPAVEFHSCTDQLRWRRRSSVRACHRQARQRDISSGSG